MAITLTAVAGCATIAPDPNTDPAGNPPTGRAAPVARPCWTAVRSAIEQPLTGTPVHTLSPTPIEISAGARTSGDEITGHQAILDSPQPAITDLRENAVVLVSLTVHTDNPAGWQLEKSLAVMAFEYVGDGTLMRVRCPLGPTDIDQPLRASGHEPLPAQIAPGQTATGWAAFIVPRTSTALTLRIQRLEPDGSYGASDTPLMAIEERGTGG